jgi:hypothetical protein
LTMISSRIAIDRPAELKKHFKDYVDGIQGIKSEATRADRFRDLIRQLFPDVSMSDIKGFYPELEKYLRTIGVGRVVRGRADALFGSLVFEFEPELDDRHTRESRDQLAKYIAAIWSHQEDLHQRRARLTSIATDGILLIVYRPRMPISEGPLSPEQVILEEIDRADISKLPAEDAYAWLNRYIVTAATELRPVDPDVFAQEFGLRSHIFEETVKLLESGWNAAKTESSALYEQWESQLRIVYGAAVGSEELYYRHSYLATLAKLVVFSNYSGGALPVTREKLVSILDGSIFREWRIVNFIEEDLFSWVQRVEDGIRAAQFLVSRLAVYDLTTVTLDVFKEIYQTLVDPEAQHDLGEFYTPDWLAELIVGEILSESARKSLLDPACGSGTFLAAAIFMKKQQIKELSSSELLTHIFQNVVGIDVHPLAVMISRATYLTTLGRELLESRSGDVIVPVYLSDSMRLPREVVTLHGGVKAYSVSANGTELVIPEDVAANSALADATIDALRDYSSEVAEGGADSPSYFQAYLTSRIANLAEFGEGIIQTLHYTSGNMVTLIKKKRDTVWAFILKNYYKPIFFRQQKFDAIVGNPPWIILRNIRSQEYRDFLEFLATQRYKLVTKKRADIIWLLEIAALFLLRVTDLYAKPNGTISFVMPRSIMVSDHHHNLRTGAFTNHIAIERILDLERVNPLFKVPACVVFCRQGGNTSYPIHASIIEGTLPRKNVALVAALKYLGQRQTEYDLYQIGARSFLDEAGKLPKITKKERSAYYQKFIKGACTDPRPLWYIDFRLQRGLGFNPQQPPVKSSEHSIKMAKRRFRDVELRGNVERRFIYSILTGSELVPFRHLQPQLAVLPIEPVRESYKILEAGEARRKKYLGLAQWLTNVEATWKRKLGNKAKKMTVYKWLDYWHQLSSQSPCAKFKVLYIASGTHLCACIAQNGPRSIRLNGTRFQVNGIIADMKTYWYETENEDEANYLCAILNSNYLDELVKPMQSKGALGERDFHKKPLEYPIPAYDSEDPTHRKLSDLGRQCSEKASKIVPSLIQQFNSIGKIRTELKKQLEEEMQKIDKLVKSLL